MIPILFDCDPGVDDALALWLAASSPSLQIQAVTTVAGNRPVDVTAANARALMTLAGMGHVPVYVGAARPFLQSEPRCNLVHGEDGLGGVELPPAGPLASGIAAVEIAERLGMARPGSVTLVATGPLTNLALAELLAPGVLARARQIVIMGGALRVPGNITPHAEFNFYADPLAADMVLACGANVVLFPLDVTERARMTSQWIGQLQQLPSRCAQAASTMLRAYGAQDMLLHDACPVAYLLAPHLFAGQPRHVSVDVREGEREGACSSQLQSANASAPNVHAMFDVDADALLALVARQLCELP